MLVSGRVATVIAFIVFILPALPAPALPALAQNTTTETPRSTLFTNVEFLTAKEPPCPMRSTCLYAET